MDKKTEALKLALELLDKQWKCEKVWALEESQDVATAIREALAEQPAQQQAPVAWVYKPNMELLWPDEIEVKDPSKIKGYKPLYTSPQASKPWVGLTDEDLSVCDEDGVMLARYWERVLREKNNG